MSARSAVTVTLALGILGVVLACSTEGPTSPEQVAAVVVTPTTVTILAFGDTVHLTATARDAVGRAIPGVSFSWQSSASRIASVSQSGVVTSHRNGPTTITATAESVSGQTQVTVVQSADSVEVSPGTVILTPQGATQQLTAEAWDHNGNRVADATFDWESSDPAIAEVSADGLVTSVSPGSVMINADAGTATGTAEVTVTEAVASVEVTPSNATLAAIGDTVRFQAVAKSADGDDLPISSFSWSSDGVNVASVDDEGLVTANGNGTATITASTAGVDGSATLVVDQLATRLTVTPDPAPTLNAVGDTVRLEASAFDANDVPITNPQFNWSSTNTAVASVDGTGLVTAEGDGSAEIKAELDGVEDSVHIEVSQQVSSVDVTPDQDTLTALNQTGQFQATARDANGFEVPGATFTWSSSDTTVGTVDGTGQVTAIANGTAVITATASGVDGSATLVVDQVAAQVDISPNPLPTFEALDETAQVTASASDANGFRIADADFNWTSEDPTVASVTPSASQGDSIASVKALGNGSTTVRAETDGVEGTVDVQVSQVVTEVEVTPSAVTFTALSQIQQLAATARDANGFQVPGQAFAWQSSNSSVASVNATGRVTSVANGLATIEATTDGVTGGSEVTVDQVTILITVDPDVVAIFVGELFVLTATAFDSNGFEIPDVSFEWESSDEAVATVNQLGGVRGVDKGIATITASDGPVEGSSEVSVDDPGPIEPGGPPRH